MKISVVIPTFNRPDALSQVLDHILLNDCAQFEDIEVIVVDDGSSLPVEQVVKSKIVTKPFRIKYLQQANSGPGIARNRGFQDASNEIVLFIDDDILAAPDLISVHYRSHQEMPGSVIFGRSPLHSEAVESPAKKYFDSLQFETESKKGLIKQQDLASGNISFERSMFPDGAVYHRQMETPGAEEFELAARLQNQGVSVYQNNDAWGWHLQSAEISQKCKQEYKYGLSLAEAFVKMPSLMENERFRHMIETNAPIRFSTETVNDFIKKQAKRIALLMAAPRAILFFTKLIERIMPSSKLLPKLYRTLCGLSLFSGVRDGMKLFKKIV